MDCFPKKSNELEQRAINQSGLSELTLSPMRRDSELSSLAIDITALENNSKFHQSQALIYAARAGAKIAQAKEVLPHGKFIEWIEENTSVSRQHANNYIRLATEYPQLLDDSNVKSNLHLPSVSQAIALMTASEEIKESVMFRLENGETVTVSEIKQLKQNYDHLSNDNKKVVNLYHESLQEIKAKETEIERLEKELEDLVKEGGIDQLIANKTAESNIIVAEMQAAQDNLRDQISRLNQEKNIAVQRAIEIELHKKQKEIDALEEKTRLAASELETIQSKIKQRNSLDALNSQFQQATAQVLEKVISADLLINTSDLNGKLFDHKTIKMLIETAQQCYKLAAAFDSLAIVKQTDLGVD
jgi:DNA repair exonuclease SbcCD ATPase subunit